jgi:L-alanine-DL-glutamate epimerase-like enolase superfamily enzyme
MATNASARIRTHSRDPSRIGLRSALKLKVGKPDPEEDRERVAKVREAVGRTTTLMVDANQSWPIDQAIGRIRSGWSL